MLPPRAYAQLARTPLNNMPEVIRRVTGGAVLNRGRVKLNVPPLVAAPRLPHACGWPIPKTWWRLPA